jgi:hypothetical protein
MKKNEAMVELLLSKGEIDVNLADNNGWMVLVEAQGHESIMKLLLAKEENN